MANTSNKRKRDSADQTGQDAPPPPPEYEPAFEAQFLQHTGEGDMTLAEALAQHNAGNDHDHSSHDNPTNGQSVTDTASAALHFSMTVPPPTEETFLAQTANEQEDRPSEPNFDIDSATNEYTNIASDHPPDVQQATPSQPPAQTTPVESSPTSGNKPNVGSDEWHKVRRDNHKEGMSSQTPA